MDTDQKELRLTLDKDTALEYRTNTMEGPKPVYRPWVGVLLSFLISGAGQYLAGRKLRGLLWWASFFLLQLVLLLLAASPGIASFKPTLVAAALVFAGWLVMLRDAHLPVPRLTAGTWVGIVVLAVVLLWAKQICLPVFVRNFYVPTASMVPTVQGARGDNPAQAKGGDYVLVERFAYWFRKPQRGEIVVFRTAGISDMPSDQFYLFRLVGLPGERISLPNGRLHVDDQPVDEPRVFKDIRYDDPPHAKLRVFSTKSGSFLVPPGHYFMLGDNARNARDSRDYGPVPAQNIFGRLTKIYWPPSRAGIPRYVAPPAVEAKQP